MPVHPAPRPLHAGRLSAATAPILTAACILLAAALISACGGPATEEPAAPAGAEILWDEWGVPHIFADRPEDLFYGFGWAQAHLHGDLILRLYGQSRGRGAEYFGDRYGEQQAFLDRWVHMMDVPQRAERWLAEQEPATRSFLDSFAAGVNDYAAAHPEAIDDAVEAVLPVTATDLLAHQQRAIQFTFMVNAGVVGTAGRYLEQRAAEMPPAGLPAAEEGDPRRIALAAPEAAYGSNAWAIAPARSASGNALLVANPHLPWSDLFTFVEGQLTGGGVDIYGVTLVGLPFPAIAFNDHVAWTHTVNTIDGVDLFELKLADGGYLMDGQLRPFEERQHSFKVPDGDGGLREESITVRHSVHGPVLAEGGGRAIALAMTGLDAADTFGQYWRMAQATSVAELEAALQEMQMPMFTVIAADDQGHILHLFGGQTPDRTAAEAGGDLDWRGIVPGDRAATMWTESHGYGELPRVLDPPSGWLHNANDPPWTTTFPRAIDAGAYPGYMAPRFMHFRAQRSAGLLMADDSLTWDELVAAKQSSRMLLADRILDDLETAVAEHGDEGARRAMAVLAAWDRTADADSRGGVLFASFARLHGIGNNQLASPAFTEPWNPERPTETPDGLADPAEAAADLTAAAQEVESAHGALDVPWGEVYRMRAGEYDLPASGGPGPLGVFRVLSFAPADDGRYATQAGETYFALIELGEEVRAEALLTYGNASQPGSPHAGDQLELFAEKKLRQVVRQREEIEQQLERRETFAPWGVPGGGEPEAGEAAEGG